MSHKNENFSNPLPLCQSPSTICKPLHIKNNSKKNIHSTGYRIKTPHNDRLKYNNRRTTTECSMYEQHDASFENDTKTRS